MDPNRVCIVIVTYNRLELLKCSLKAVRHQSYENFDVVVVNNGSTDGTKEYLYAQKDLIVIHQDNIGGSGGFFTGMSYMYNHGYEWLLLLDDDGLPDKDALRNLLISYDEVKSLAKTDVILNALVVNIDNHEEVAFPWKRGTDFSSKVSDVQKLKYINQIQPFNGTLIPRIIIEQIGMIKKEMFIYGDEEEYRTRALHNGFGCYTVTSAIHYHPKDRGLKKNVIPFCRKYKVRVFSSNRSKYFYRNMGYIFSKYPEKRKNYALAKFICAYFVFNALHLKITELYKFLIYFVKGWNGNFIM